MVHDKVDAIDVNEQMQIVCEGGLDDDMYEDALQQLSNLQIRYNALVEELEQQKSSPETSLPNTKLAFQMVCNHFPRVDRVIINPEGQWIFEDADGNAPSFEGIDLDCDVFESMVTELDRLVGIPVVCLN